LSHRLESSPNDIQGTWSINQPPLDFSGSFHIPPAQNLKTDGNSITVIELRNINNVASTEFVDRLQLGINVISIQIADLPAGSVFKLAYVRVI
jgi:hypothetical protein